MIIYTQTKADQRPHYSLFSKMELFVTGNSRWKLSKCRLSHGFPKQKIYNDPDDGIYNFSRNDFFLIILQSNHASNKEHKVFLGHLFCNYFFEEYMLVIMQNFVKELNALDYVLLVMNCVPAFAIYAVLLQPTSKIIRNTFRGYFKIGVQRASWIYFTFTTIHCMTSITMSMRWSKLQKQKRQSFFAAWGCFYVYAIHYNQEPALYFYRN